MEKLSKEFVLNLGIICLTIIILFLLLFKFNIFNRKKDIIHNDYQDISVSNLEGKRLSFVDLLETKKNNYILFMEVNNCSSCILNGLQLLKSFNKKDKHHCVMIVVHDWLKELKNWAYNYDFEEIYVIPSVTFYENFSLEYLPTIISVNSNKVRIVKRITF